MEFIVFGLNHRTAPLEVRERWAVPPQRHHAVLQSLHGRFANSEHLIVSTCNRTEFYSHVPRSASPLPPDVGDDSGEDSEFGDQMTRSTLRFYHEVCQLMAADSWDGARDHNPDYFYAYRQEAAVQHLFRLAAGLDSMIVGESQILKQLKDAYAAAQEAETVGTFFHRLFPTALRVGKRIRSDTKISDGCITPGQAGIELARRVHGELNNRTVLVVGSGKIAGLTMQAIQGAGIAKCVVVNRTREHAKELVERIGIGTSAPWSELNDRLQEADLVISSTSSVNPIVGREALASIAAARGDRPLVLIDLAIPRDFSADVGAIPGIHLFNIDDLNEVIQENVARRHSQVPRAEKIIREEFLTFQGQLIYQQVNPVLKHLNHRFEQIRLGVLQQFMGQFPADQHDLVDQMSSTLAKKLLHFPISKLKSLRNLKDLNETEVLFLQRLFLADPPSEVESDHAKGRPEEK